MSIVGSDPHFSQFANSLMALMEKHEPILKNKVDMTPAERDAYLLAVQKEQITTLLSLEKEFRDLMVESGIAPDVYRKFVSYIRDERRNILVARPFFRERQQVFTSRVSPALERRDYNELMTFSFNATFIQFVLRCRRWSRESEKFLSSYPWWQSLGRGRLPKTLPNEKRMMEIVKAIFDLRNLIVECNLPLVVDWASKFYRKTPQSYLSRMDMVNISTEGLIAAIDKLELAAFDENDSTYAWQGGDDTEEVQFTKEPGSVFRSVGIGRMTGNLIENYSATLVHFWPKDRRKLYRANKGRAKIDSPTTGEPKTWTGIDGVDFDKLAAVVNTDEKSGNLVEESHRTDAAEIADLMAASSCVSPVDEEGNDQMSKFAAEDLWRPDSKMENREIMSIVKREIRDLSLIERKLLMLSGIEF